MSVLKINFYNKFIFLHLTKIIGESIQFSKFKYKFTLYFNQYAINNFLSRQKYFLQMHYMTAIADVGPKPPFYSFTNNYKSGLTLSAKVNYSFSQKVKCIMKKPKWPLELAICSTAIGHFCPE